MIIGDPGIPCSLPNLPLPKCSARCPDTVCGWHSQGRPPTCPSHSFSLCNSSGYPWEKSLNLCHSVHYPDGTGPRLTQATGYEHNSGTVSAWSMPGVYLKTLVVHTPEHAHLFICKWRTLCEWCVWICPVLIYHVCYKYPSSKSMFFKKLIQKYIGGSLDIFSPRPIIWCTALWGILHSWKSNPLWVWMYWGGRKRPLEILWKSGGSFDLANKPTKWCVGSVFICDGLRFW